MTRQEVMMTAPQKQFADSQRLWLLALIAILGVVLCAVGWYRWFS
jgi:hypothetical protein